MECDRQGSMLCEPAGLQFVSLMTCFQELLIECLSTRSTFISAQNDMLNDSMDDEVKVPAEAAKAWIRALFCTPDQLKSLDNSTLLQCVKVCHILMHVSAYIRGVASCFAWGGCSWLLFLQ